MFTRILQAFAAPRPAPLPEPDARLALGALMVRVAKVDHRYDVAEIGQIDRLLAHLYGLNPVEAAKMRATCERLAADPAAGDFAALIRETVSRDVRIEALEALWQVVLSDGHEGAEEQGLVSRTAAALGLDETESRVAHRRAEAHVQGGGMA